MKTDKYSVAQEVKQDSLQCGLLSLKRQRSLGQPVTGHGMLIYMGTLCMLVRVFLLMSNGIQHVCMPILKFSYSMTVPVSQTSEHYMSTLDSFVYTPNSGKDCLCSPTPACSGPRRSRSFFQTLHTLVKTLEVGIGLNGRLHRDTVYFIHLQSMKGRRKQLESSCAQFNNP